MTKTQSLVFAQLFSLFFILGLFSSSAYAETGKAGKSYVSFATIFNEFRSIDIPLQSDEAVAGLPRFFPESGQTYGVALGYGRFLDDYFKVELRAGTGVRDDTIREALDVNLSYWLNWFIGYQYPITSYMSAYAQYGVTVFEADDVRREFRVSAQTDSFGSTQEVTARPSDNLQDGLFDSSFSQSWILGLEFSLIDNWFLGVEYGTLIRGEDSNLNVRQAGLHLRYLY